MPFTAQYKGEERGAWTVPKDETAHCIECGGRMMVVSEGADGTARHFRHYSETGYSSSGAGGNGRRPGCGGEGDEHKKWKNFAAERLQEIFGNRAKEPAAVELRLAAPWSDSEHRDADACILFKNRDRQFGYGLAVEVQHKNKDKDTHAVAMDYDRQDIAVLWLYKDDFNADGLPMGEVDMRHRVRKQTSICERCPKWSRHFERYSHAEPPETHEQHINRAHDPRDREVNVPATTLRDWYVPTPTEHWRSAPWEERFRTVAGGYHTQHDRGERTRIPVSIPATIDSENIKQQLAMYRCSACRWKGDDYSIVDGTAVCPSCSGGLRLNRAVQAGMHT